MLACSRPEITRARGKLRVPRLKCRPRGGEESPSERSVGRRRGGLEVGTSRDCSFPCALGLACFKDEIIPWKELDLEKDSRHVFASEINEGVREPEGCLCEAFNF